ncbi:hypothetical protein CLU97_1354 [Chryseobacterium sp. 7]|uniref:hypothetical protein n=1 Tax=Chryseobacterium sp. 7 TaxID=2035214 RepID=UPI000EB4CE5C|nr:hypothetical protein [Chryseobacterium sp. 7]RLJ31913.1 hypothetical protein CLU97_1354 [Chryseobacterium sp. 7]
MISKEEANQLQKLSHSAITVNSAVGLILYGEKMRCCSEKEIRSAVFMVKTAVDEVEWAKKIL